jgi:hypothetical protein
MSDISDDEKIEKPKRVMTDKQKEALKKGRELAKANRAAQKAEAPKQAEEQPEKKKREKKVKEVKEVVNEVIEAPKGQRISRQPKTRETSPEPERSPSPEPVVKKTRTPRKKAEQVEAPPTPKVVRQKPALQFV